VKWVKLDEMVIPIMGTMTGSLMFQAMALASGNPIAAILFGFFGGWGTSIVFIYGLMLLVRNRKAVFEFCEFQVWKAVQRLKGYKI